MYIYRHTIRTICHVYKMLKLIIWYEINLGLLYKTAFKGKFILL